MCSQPTPHDLIVQRPQTKGDKIRQRVRHCVTGVRLIVALQPLCACDARNVKPIGSAKVNRRRTESSYWRKIVDMQTRANQMIGDMEHHHFADKQRICAKRLRAEQFALETGPCLRHTRRFDANGGCGVQMCRCQLALPGRKVRRRNIHRVEQVLGNQIHHKLAAGQNIIRGVLGFAGIVETDADDYVKRVGAYRVEKAERREIDNAALAQAGDPRDWTRNHQIGQQLVVIRVWVQGGIDLHEGCSRVSRLG